MIILGIETSCDETSASIIRASNNKIEVLSNIVSSQIELHAKWGGVVPNLAAREHLKNTIPVFEESLKKAGIKKENIDLISATQGPGLIPALLIGTNFAKTLSYLIKKPLLGIHHIEGHIYANFIGISQRAKHEAQNNIKFPLLALVVSGGHTQLILMKDHLQYEIIGETQDDAAGEAFDKVARVLGLGYPGGPAISALADNFKFQILNFKSNSNDLILNKKNDVSNLKNSNFNRNSKFETLPTGRQVQNSLKLPRPMINSKDFNFSFSGLKTAVLYAVKKLTPSQISSLKPQICHEFQQAVIDVLISKTIKAAQKYNPKTIILAGGVSANQELNKQMKTAIKNDLPDTKFSTPKSPFSLDNAAMIATAGYYRWKNMNEKEKEESENRWKSLQADANLKI